MGRVSTLGQIEVRVNRVIKNLRELEELVATVQLDKENQEKIVKAINYPLLDVQREMQEPSKLNVNGFSFKLSE